MSIRRFFGAMCLAASATLAHAGTYSDLWFNPQEPGWGVQVTEQVETAFITFYTYDAAGKPTWFVASDAQVVAYSNPGSFPIYEGALYRTEGSFHGGPYRPAEARAIPVGRITLEVTDKNRMRVFYSADGVSGVKEVRRFAFAQPIDLANFDARMSLRQVIGSQPVGVLDVQADMLVHLDSAGAQGFIRTDDQLGRRCEYRGPYELIGKLVRMSGTYSCTSGDQRSGTFELTDFEVTAHGATGFLRTRSGNDSQYGRLAALRW